MSGKRLYVTTSLFSPWDKQFYPDMVDVSRGCITPEVGHSGSDTLERLDDADD